MKQFTPGETKDIALAPGETGRPHSRVLVADDGEADRFLTIWQLGKVWPVEADILVECAADGTEALEKIRSSQYALVVLDWNMPQLNGADVLRALRETDLRVPVVVVSDQCCEATASYLKTMTAAFVNKDELDTGSLRIAIAASIQLQETRGSHELAGFTSKTIWQPDAGRVPPRRPRVHSRPHAVTRAFDCQSGPATLNSSGSQGNNDSTEFATCPPGFPRRLITFTVTRRVGSWMNESQMGKYPAVNPSCDDFNPQSSTQLTFNYPDAVLGRAHKSLIGEFPHSGQPFTRLFSCHESQARDDGTDVW